MSTALHIYALKIWESRRVLHTVKSTKEHEEGEKRLRMQIRQYNSSDLVQSRSLWAEMVQRHRDIYNDPSIGGDNPGLEFDIHLERVGPQYIWLAEDKEELVGLVSLILNEQQAEIEPIIVKSDYRGQGIGQKLLYHSIEQAKKLNVLCLSVKPVARNLDAISFFYNSGFKALGQIELFMWLGDSTPFEWKKGLNLFGKSFDY
jgi:N-acetylglutamate synthase-like GNAT family acetyltransferase